MDSEDAVSEVVGTVIILGLVVLLFTVLSISALGVIGDSTDPERPDLHALQRGDQALVIHQGGDPVPLYAEVMVRFTNGSVTRTPISELTGDWTSAWSVGQSLCFSCDYIIADVDAYAVILGNEFLLEVDLVA